MRTPGSDVELAQGFLLTEGVIGHRDDIARVEYCRGAGRRRDQHLQRARRDPCAAASPMPEVDVTRNFYTTSSCGVCGKASLDAVRLISRHSPGDDPARVDAETFCRPCPSQLRERAEGIRQHRRSARCGAVRSRRHHAGRPRGHRPSQRRRQGHRLGTGERPNSRSAAQCYSSADEHRSS